MEESRFEHRCEIRYRHEGGFPIIAFGGDLDRAGFYALNAAMQGFVAGEGSSIVVDFSGCLSISEELTHMGCKGLFGCPFGCTIVVVGERTLLHKLSSTLDLPYTLHYAGTVKEAIDTLNGLKKPA